MEQNERAAERGTEARTGTPPSQRTGRTARAGNSCAGSHGGAAAKRLEELKEAQRRAQKAARRTYINQRKYAVGGLAQIAGLLEADPGFVLGLMLEAAEQRDRDGTWPSAVFERYKHRGDQVLAERAAARKRRKSTGDDDEDDDVEFGPAAVPMQENRYQEGAH